VAALRRLIYCGEWIESHALHVYLLHAPDFLGYRSGVEMAASRLGPECRNPFRSIIVRAVEMVYALEEALRVVAVYEPPGRPAADLLPERDGVVLNSWADDVIPHGHENREEVAEPLDVDKPGMGTLVTVSITAIRSGRATPFRCSPSPDPGRRRHGHWPADLRDLGPCSGWLSPLCGLG
jgi:hypothetical protein